MLKKCEICHKNRKTASFWNLCLLLLLFWRDEIPPGCVWYALRVNRHIFSDTFSFFREFSFELNIKKDPVYNWLLDADSKFMMGQQGDLRHGMRSEERSFLLYLLINRKFMFHCARCKKSLKRVQHRPGGIEIKFFNCPMVNLWSFMFKNDEPILLSPFDVYVECQIWCICRPYLNPGELGLSDIIQCLKRSLEIRLRDLFLLLSYSSGLLLLYMIDWLKCSDLKFDLFLLQIQIWIFVRNRYCSWVYSSSFITFIMTL